MKTDKQLLVEIAYEGDLGKAVGHARASGMSWRAIERAVNHKLTGVRVSREALRAWYSNEEPGRAA